MTRPVVSEVGERLYDAMGTMQRGDSLNQWSLLLFCAAFTQSLAHVLSYAEDSESFPGWGLMLSVDEAPSEALPYLSQFVGVRFDIGLSDTEMRSTLRDTANWRRGTLEAILTAGRAYLTGAKQFLVEERYQDKPYVLRIRCYRRETPNAELVERALRLAVPAGIILIFEVIDGISYNDLDDAYTSYDDMKSTGKTYTQLSTEPNL